MSEEEKLREELELVRCDLHNAYSILDGRNEEIERLNNIIKEQNEKLDKYSKMSFVHEIELMEENKRLNNIIDKAIDYIDWQRRNPQYDNVWRNSECEDLIEILKGE